MSIIDKVKGIFKNNGNLNLESEQRKRGILNRLDDIIGKSYKLLDRDAKNLILSIKENVDNPELKLNTTQLDKIEKELGDIERHLDNREYVNKKCKNIEKILRTKEVNESMNEEVIEENTDKILELEVELGDLRKSLDNKNLKLEELEKNISDLEAKSNQSVIDNKRYEWKKIRNDLEQLRQDKKKVSEEINSLKYKFNIKQNSINSLQTHNRNIELTGDIREAGVISKVISDQSGLVDVETARATAEETSKVSASVQNQANEIGDIIGANYSTGVEDGFSEEDAEFDRLRESILLEEKEKEAREKKNKN